MHQRARWTIWELVSLLSVVALVQTGCIAVISAQVRQEADRTITLEQLRARPEAYMGRLVIMGGEIVRTTNVPGSTLLEVLQKPLDSTDRPLETDRSEGRFMVRCDRYLDPVTYTAGRVVTVAGRVLGTSAAKIGEIDYVYPLLACVEIYLWPETVYVTPLYPDVWYWWEGDPWYWDPWYWRLPPQHFRRRWPHHRPPHHRTPHHRSERPGRPR
jgi:outer membrane lipoprotein